MHYTPPSHIHAEEREGYAGAGGGWREASIRTVGDTTFEWHDRGHTVVPLQLNYAVHKGEALRIDTSIESVSAALWGPTISVSAEINLLPLGATIAGQTF